MDRRIVLYFLCGCTLFCESVPEREVISCPLKCTCHWRTFSAFCKNVSTVPNFREYSNKLLTLDLTNNGISEINRLMFSNMSALQTLILSNNSINLIPNETFKDLKEIRTLRLDHNKLTNIMSANLALQKKIQILDMSKNALESIDLYKTSIMSSLSNLNLANNGLTQVHIEPFLPETLISLNLEKNSLSVIPENLCAKGSQLNQIHLNNNNISKVHNFSFINCSSLKALYLHANKISIVESHAFVLSPRPPFQESTIQTLILNGNNLKEFPSHVIALWQLRTLEISLNPMRTLRTDDFKGFNKTTQFQASYMPFLERIEEGVFRHMTSLRHINMCCNKHVSALDVSTFRGLNDIEDISLANNSITAFPEKLLNWRQLHLVDIRNNPLHCTCNQSWIQIRQNWATNITWSMVREITCASPDPVTGRKMVSLTLMDLGCQKSFDARLQTAAVFGVVSFVLFFLVFLVCKYRKSVLLRWKYYRYARHTDESTYSIEKEMEEYIPSGNLQFMNSREYQDA